MSLSNNTDLTNVATRFFEWSSQDQKVKWYDKEAKTNVLVELPFTFIVLDMLSTVKGFSDTDQSGIWANEVRDTRKDTLTVRTAKGIRAQGLYQDVKTLEGARYCRSVYIAYKNEDDKLVIGNFQMHGICNSEFIEFTKSHKPYGIAIQVVGADQRKKGTNTFYAPVFKAVPISDATLAEAIELDKQVQEYLTQYLGRKQEIDGYTGVDDFDEYAPNETQEMPDYVNDAQESDDFEF